MGIEVVVEGLTKSFGRRTVWRDVTLSLPPGEVSVMLGPSGTGKTVFLKSLIGLLKPDRGKVFVDGVDTGIVGPLEVALELEIVRRIGENEIDGPVLQSSKNISCVILYRQLNARRFLANATDEWRPK